MKATLVPPVIGMLVLCTGCEPEKWDDCFTPVGEIVMDERDVGTFTAIDLSDRFDLVITPDTVDRLIIEAGQRVLEQLRTEVIDGALVIRDENTCHWVRRFDAPLVAHVHSRTLRELICRGTGNVSCTGPITTTVFEVMTWNANGTIDLRFEGDTCVIGNNTGAADILVTGTAQQARLYSGGLGRIDTRELAAVDVLVYHDGGNDMQLRASGSLGATLISNGDVYYTGGPVILWSTITGSGSLIQL